MNTFRIGLITWNVGGAAAGITPGTERLLQVAQTSDVVIVGLQEVSVARRGWKSALRRGLGDGWAYVGGESYAGLRIKVFARLTTRITSDNVLRSTPLSPNDSARAGLNARAGRYPLVSVTGAGKRVGVGVADRWPNKGAVAVEIRFSPSCSAVFIVAHLAANEHQLQGRKDDWKAILRRLDRDDLALARAADSVIAVPLFHRYEHVFVLGDLNYRIAPPGSDLDQRVKWVQERIDKHDWPALADADQLVRERHGGSVFANFEEAPIAFAPTFKFDPKTGRYAQNRVPSYCDRILWHSLPAREKLVRCTKYTSLPQFRQSDHLPVFAQFELDVPVAPMRPLNPMKGMRIVLEFMLVRFVKGTRPCKQSSNASRLMKQIAAPASLNIAVEIDAPISTNDMHKPSGSPQLITAADIEEDEDDDDDDDVDDVEDDSSISSDEEENYAPNDNDIDDGSYSPYESADSPLEAANESINEGRILPYLEDGIETDTLASVLKHDSSTESTAIPGGAQSYNVALLSSDALNRSPLSASAAACTAEFSRDTNGLNAFYSNTGYLEVSSSPTTSPETIEPVRTPVQANSGPRKRDSLSRQVENNEKNPRARKRNRFKGVRMEVHGAGLFLKQGRVYRVSIPKHTNGIRERIGESLPVIPLAPLSSLEDLHYRHVLIEFAKKNTRVGTSGVLPLSELLSYIGRPYSFEMPLTKYGFPVGTLEACVQLTVSDSAYWVDAKGRVVRNLDGGASRHYRGLLPVRKRTRAKSKYNGSKRG